MTFEAEHIGISFPCEKNEWKLQTNSEQVSLETFYAFIFYYFAIRVTGEQSCSGGVYW